MKIRVFVKTKGCFPKVFAKGDWIDLLTAEEVSLKAPYAKRLRKRTAAEPDETADRMRDVVFNSCLIPLGVAMRLPEGFEAVVVPRSSTFRKFGIMQANSFGVLDHSYCSEDDEWAFPAVATRSTVIPKNTRICQFRIQLSQKATLWQKLCWLLSGRIELVPVASLEGQARGGFGAGTDGAETPIRPCSNE